MSTLKKVLNDILKNRKSVFWKFLISYILIISMTLITLTPFLLNIYEKDIEFNLREYTNLCDDILLEFVAEVNLINNTIQSIYLTEGFKRLILTKGEIKLEDYLYLELARKSMLTYSCLDNNIADVILMFNNNDIVITKYNAFNNSSSFFSYYNLDKLDVNINKNIKSVKLYPEMVIKSDTYISKDVLPLSFTLYNGGNSYGFAYFFLDKHKLFNSLHYIINNGGYIKVYYDNNPILTKGDTNNFDEYYNVNVTNSDLSLMLTLGIPSNLFYTNYASLLTVMIQYLVLAFLVGIILALILTITRFKPIDELLSSLYESENIYIKNTNEFDLVKDKYKEIKNQNLVRQQQIEIYKKTVENNMIERILSSQNIHTSVYEVPKIFCDKYIVCYSVIEVREDLVYDNPTELYYNSVEYLKAKIDSKNIIHIITEDSFIVIISAVNENASNELIIILSNYSCNGSVHVSYSMSDTFCGLENVNLAYEQARKRYYYFKKAQIENILEDNNSNININSLKNLYYLVISTNKDEACQLVKNSFVCDIAPMFDFEQLYYSIRGTLLNCLSQLSEKSRKQINIPKYNVSKRPSQIVDDLCKTIIKLCDLFLIERKSNNIELKDEILKYIHDNFTDQNLYINTLAEHFSISEKYLCSFFKEQTGTTINTVLNEMRLEYVAKLIATTDMPINTLYLKAGFNTYNNLYKTFKRKYGMSLREYKTMTQENSLTRTK